MGRKGTPRAPARGRPAHVDVLVVAEVVAVADEAGHSLLLRHHLVYEAAFLVLAHVRPVGVEVGHAELAAAGSQDFHSFAHLPHWLGGIITPIRPPSSRPRAFTRDFSAASRPGR